MLNPMRPTGQTRFLMILEPTASTRLTEHDQNTSQICRTNILRGQGPKVTNTFAMHIKSRMFCLVHSFGHN